MLYPAPDIDKLLVIVHPFLSPCVGLFRLRLLCGLSLSRLFPGALGRSELFVSILIVMNVYELLLHGVLPSRGVILQ